MRSEIKEIETLVDVQPDGGYKIGMSVVYQDQFDNYAQFLGKLVGMLGLDGKKFADRHDIEKSPDYLRGLMWGYGSDEACNKAGLPALQKSDFTASSKINSEPKGKVVTDDEAHDVALKKAHELWLAGHKINTTVKYDYHTRHDVHDGNICVSEYWRRYTGKVNVIW